MQPRRSPKHGKPAFDVVRDAVDDPRTGWVYRSDTVRPAQPAARAPAAAAPPRFLPSPPPPPRSAGTPPPKAVRPAAARPSFGWVAGAVTLMALPVVMTAGMMIAPIALVWAARKSTNG